MPVSGIRTNGQRIERLMFGPLRTLARTTPHFRGLWESDCEACPIP
jgi:hypothetical protein